MSGAGRETSALPMSPSAATTALEPLGVDGPPASGPATAPSSAPTGSGTPSPEVPADAADPVIAARALLEAMGDYVRLSRGAETLEVKGFTRLQISILTRLDRHGATRLTALAADLHLDLSVVSRQAARLVETGLVERAPDPRDKRACLVALTPAGRDVVQAVRRRRDEWLARILEPWDAEQIAQATAVVRDIVAGVRDHVT